jgi:hypothetical protein
MFKWGIFSKYVSVAKGYGKLFCLLGCYTVPLDRQFMVDHNAFFSRVKQSKMRTSFWDAVSLGEQISTFWGTVVCCLSGSHTPFLGLEYERWCYVLEHRELFTEQHSVTSHRTWTSNTAMRTSFLGTFLSGHVFRDLLFHCVKFSYSSSLKTLRTLFNLMNCL